MAKAFGPGHTPAPVAVVRSGDPAHPEAGQLGDPAKRRPLSKEAKIALKTAGAIVVALVALILISKVPSARTATLTTLTKAAAVEEVRNVSEDEKAVPVTRDDVEILLNATLTPNATKTPAQVYLALAYAKPTEASDFDIDAAIVNFILKQFTTNDHCDTQLLDVVRKRKNAASAPPLLEFCRTTGNASAAIAAIQACRTIQGERLVHHRFQCRCQICAYPLVGLRRRSQSRRHRQERPRLHRQKGATRRRPSPRFMARRRHVRNSA